MIRILIFTFLFFGQFAYATKESKKILNVRMPEPPVNLDWNGLSTIGEAPFIINLCEGLFTYEYPSGKLIPGIAASVEKSKDQTVYKFKIREDAKWSDGRAIYAQDFVDAWTRVISPSSTSVYTYYFFDVLNAREYNSKTIGDASKIGFKALNDRTLEVHLKRPVKNWEANTAFWPFYPIRKDKIERFGANWWRAGVLVSSGPFIFESFEIGKMAVLKRNPFYKNFHSNVNEVDFYFVDNHEEALKKYESGFFDFLWGVPFPYTQKFKGNHEYQTIDIMRGYLFGLNAEKYPMSDKEFRLAILSALDPKKLVPEGALVKNAKGTLIPSPLPGSFKSTLIQFDPLAAKEHLKKSGVLLTKGSQVRLLTGVSEPGQSAAKLIQAQIDKVLGLKVEVAAHQSHEYVAYMNLGDYNATLLTWTAKVVSPQDFLLPYSGEAIFNRLHFKNPAYDEFILKGAQAKTDSLAQDAFYKAQAILTQEEAILIPLFFEKNANLIRPKIKHLYFNHMGIPVLKDVEIQ